MLISARRGCTIAAALLAASLVGPGPAGAATASPPGSGRVLATFDHALGETPENQVVVGGTRFVSLAFASTVVALAASGAELDRVVLDTRGGFVAGLAYDRRRCALAVAVSSPSAEVSGVWEFPVTHDGLGHPSRLALLPPDAFPNGLAFDPHGDLFAADSLLATLWRVPAGTASGRPAQAWLVDPALGPDPTAPGLPGANGLKVHDGQLYVSNTARSTVLKVPLRMGRPGAVTTWRRDLRVDDFTFASDGSFYAALNQADQVVRVDLQGAVTVLATAADGLHDPSSVTVARRGRQLVVDVTNAAFDGPQPPPTILELSISADG